MSEMRQVPVNMSHEELLAVLADITDRVRHGDSFEGSLTYAIPEDPEAAPGSFDVLASYRIGNSMGQGGMRMIGEWTDEAQEWPAEPSA